MNISIKLVSDRPIFIDTYISKEGKIEENILYEGQIQIENFKETFELPTNYWSLDDYIRQWREGLERIRTHDTSCLVAIVQNPCVQPLINWWVLYKEGNKIFVQNELIVDEVYTELIGSNSFTPETCYRYIVPRTTVTKEGLRVSEWSTIL